MMMTVSLCLYMYVPDWRSYRGTREHSKERCIESDGRYGVKGVWNARSRAHPPAIRRDCVYIEDDDAPPSISQVSSQPRLTTSLETLAEEQPGDDSFKFEPKQGESTIHVEIIKLISI